MDKVYPFPDDIKGNRNDLARSYKRLVEIKVKLSF